MNLTSKQQRVLSFIERYRAEQQMSPTYQEIQSHFGYASPNAVQKHVRSLIEKGAIMSDRGRSRGKSRALMPVFSPGRSVPLVGRIAAGVPIEAIEQIERHLDITSLGFDNSNGDYFALQVKGDSMINAHILDDDLVIIKKQPEVVGHEIAAVLWNGEATLKYIKRSSTGISLIPANDRMRPIMVDEEKTESFRILGKVVGIIRVKENPKS